MKKNSTLNIIFGVICIPINLLLMLLGDAFIWAGITILVLFLLKKYAPKNIWIALIIITLITILGTFSPRPMMKSETNQIYNYLSDKYGKDTFKIKKKSLTIVGSDKFCGGTWISFCIGFKMFHWTNLDVVVIDENGVEFELEAKLTGFNKFEKFRDEYKAELEIDTMKNYMNNKLIPILNQYSITDVKYEPRIILVTITKESVDRDMEEEFWDEIIQKLQYNGYIDPSITIVYRDRQNNPIEYYYLWLRDWN